MFRLGYSKKRWTDGKIGVLWIEQFDEQTKAKTDGCAQILLVDGHNSHYTQGFLEYHNIHILCYPAYTTHIYQGIDVAIFRERWEHEKGEKVNKENFLVVYGATHMCALTCKIISQCYHYQDDDT